MTTTLSPNYWDTVIGTTKSPELLSIRRKMSELHHCGDPDMDNLTMISGICFKKEKMSNYWLDSFLRNLKK